MRALLLVALLSGFVLAGCLGGGSDEVELEDDETARATDETGSVTGQVFNEELNAVANASIWVVDKDMNLIGGSETRTDGRYTVNDVPPGTYRLQVSHLCCRQELREFIITAGEIITVNFQLKFTDVPHIIDPRVETDEWVGFIGCSHGIPPPFWIHCGQALDDRHNPTKHIELEPGLRTLSLGITWSSTGSQYGMNENKLNVVVELQVQGHNTVVLADLTEENPIALRFDNSELGDNAFENFDEEEERTLKVAVSGPELTLIYQQSFKLYWALHYWHEAPPGYTVLPDV